MLSSQTTTISLLHFLFLILLVADSDAFLAGQRRAVIAKTESTESYAAANDCRPSKRMPSDRFVAANQDEGISSPKDQRNATAEPSSPKGEAEPSSALSQALLLRQQARKLRDEANAEARALEEEKENRLALQNSKIDRWIEDLLVQYRVNDDTELLHTVDQVLDRLRDGRYSQEQVYKIFDRICEIGPPQSRSRCSPIMALFVDAVGKLDAVERDENPNKRWSGKAERRLRKKLFAMDWGIELEEEDDDGDSGNPWKLR